MLGRLLHRRWKLVEEVETLPPRPRRETAEMLETAVAAEAEKMLQQPLWMVGDRRRRQRRERMSPRHRLQLVVDPDRRIGGKPRQPLLPRERRRRRHRRLPPNRRTGAIDPDLRDHLDDLKGPNHPQLLRRRQQP